DKLVTGVQTCALPICPATLGQLRESGWKPVPVKEEVRRNAVRKIAAGEPVFEHVLGYEDTVFPQLENALLAGHDIIFLGERGQEIGRASCRERGEGAV